MERKLPSKQGRVTNSHSELRKLYYSDCIFFFHSSENFPCVQSLEYFVLSFFFKSVRNDEKMRLRQFFLVG